MEVSFKRCCSSLTICLPACFLHVILCSTILLASYFHQQAFHNFDHHVLKTDQVKIISTKGQTLIFWGAEGEGSWAISKNNSCREKTAEKEIEQGKPWGNKLSKCFILCSSFFFDWKKNHAHPEGEIKISRPRKLPTFPFLSMKPIYLCIVPFLSGVSGVWSLQIQKTCKGKNFFGVQFCVEGQVPGLPALRLEQVPAFPTIALTELCVTMVPAADKPAAIHWTHHVTKVTDGEILNITEALFYVIQ